MDKIAEAKAEFRLKQWTQIIQTCQASGMTITGWCNQNNVNAKTYYYWLRKLRFLACESTDVALINKHQIVPLAFKHEKAAAVSVTIHVSSASIDIHEGESKATIETVLSALKNIC